MIQWLQHHVVELLGVLFSLTYLVLSIRQNIWLWPVGIASAIMYIVVFFQAKFYADMSLNVYYFVVSIYGWIYWSRAGTGAGTEKNKSLPVSRVRRRTSILSFAVFILLFAGGAYILDRFTDSPLPWWDAFTTAGSVIATWMLARKYLEHWILWIVVDLVAMGLYIYRGLYPTAVLFLVYTLMAIVGYIQWKKEIITNEIRQDTDHRA